MKRLILSLVVAVAAAAPVLAQPAPAKPDVSALETSGFKHYQLAEYDAAITDFKEAYRISEEPAFLYNIAQAYRMKNDCREAATFYKNYLRAATDKKGAEPSNAAKVRSLVAEMETCAAKQPAPTTTPTPTPTPEPTPPTTPPTTTATTEPIDEPIDEPPATTGKPKWMRWAGIAGIGAGALGLGLATKFALDGKSANDDLKEKCAISCTSEEALSIESDGKAANRNAVIFGIAGGAVLAGGVVLLVLSLRDGGTEEQEEPAASLELTPGGASAAYAWRF